MTKAKIIKSKLIESPMDIIELDIIDFNRLNGYWNNSKEALDTIFSWFNGIASATIMKFDNYFDAPKRDDFPNWKHCGYHEEIAQEYWNWFFWNYPNPNNKLYLSDSPDFHGIFEKHFFWGDIGKVSASAFAMTQKQMGMHDLWISLLGQGDWHVVIEPLVSIIDLWDKGLKDGCVASPHDKCYSQ